MPFSVILVFKSFMVRSSLVFLILLPKRTVLYCYFHMYCAFRDTKCFRCLPHCGIMVDDIVGYPNSSFFNIVFQRKTPQDTFLQCMKVSEGLCPDYLYLFILFIFRRIACQYIRSFNTLITVTVVPLTIKKIKYVLYGL